jgi:hypothetical protein
MKFNSIADKNRRDRTSILQHQHHRDIADKSESKKSSMLEAVVAQQQSIMDFYSSLDNHDIIGTKTIIAYDIDHQTLTRLTSYYKQMMRK